jgi:ankyrin repeat protein
MVKLLLEQKRVDVDSKDNCGQVPLFYTVKHRKKAVVKLLLEKAVDIDSKDNDIQTPLSWARLFNRKAVIRLPEPKF